jgi:hypothetical protein
LLRRQVHKAVGIAKTAFWSSARRPAGRQRIGFRQQMWDVLTWHDGTLSVAWWALLGFALLVIIAAGSRAAGK